MLIMSSMPRHWPICANAAFADQDAWTAHLDRLGVLTFKVNPDPVMVATEGALWGSIRYGHRQ
jgi:hypothetical protein